MNISISFLASKLTMDNVPWHEEVIYFVEELAKRLPNYEISCEHEHSNCVLLTNKKFKIDGEWWTWIDYPKFHELIKRYHLSNGKETFKAVDYMARTPPWATYGSKERGFDPAETRFHRNKNMKSDGGCG